MSTPTEYLSVSVNKIFSKWNTTLVNVRIFLCNYFSPGSPTKYVRTFLVRGQPEKQNQQQIQAKRFVARNQLPRLQRLPGRAPRLWGGPFTEESGAPRQAVRCRAQNFFCFQETQLQSKALPLIESGPHRLSRIFFFA